MRDSHCVFLVLCVCVSAAALASRQPARIVPAMVYDLDDPAAQVAACWAIWEMAPSLFDRLVQLGVLSALTAALTQHATSPDIQKAACAAITTLLQYNNAADRARRQDAAGDAGVCAAIAASLLAAPVRAVDIVDGRCAVLEALLAVVVRHAANQQRARLHGLPAAVEALMAVHPQLHPLGMRVLECLVLTFEERTRPVSLAPPFFCLLQPCPFVTAVLRVGQNEHT